MQTLHLQKEIARCQRMLIVTELLNTGMILVQKCLLPLLSFLAGLSLFLCARTELSPWRQFKVTRKHLCTTLLTQFCVTAANLNVR